MRFKRHLFLEGKLLITPSKSIVAHFCRLYEGIRIFISKQTANSKDVYKHLHRQTQKQHYDRSETVKKATSKQCEERKNQKEKKKERSKERIKEIERFIIYI